MDATHGLLGRIAVHKGWITHAQLIEAVAEQGRFGNEEKRLGEILVGLGYLSTQQLEALLEAQRAFLARQKEKEHKPIRPKTGAQIMPDPEQIKAQSSRVDDGGWKPGQDPMAAASAARQTRPAAQVRPAARPAMSTPARVRPPATVKSALPPDEGGIELDWKPPSAEQKTPVSTQAPPTQAPVTQAPVTPPQPAQVAPAPSAEVVEPHSQLRAMPKRNAALDEVLAAAARRGASDVHLHPQSPLALRLHGELLAEGQKLEANYVSQLVTPTLRGNLLEVLESGGQVDFAYEVPGIGRFRANVYDGHTGRNAVFRFIPSFIPSLAQLQLPNELAAVTAFHQGMVLVTGPAGSGKSTTLAALVDLINDEREDHILSVEDPVEYVHDSKRCIVNQREVHRHTTSFARALRAALREDPDILVIGELRDLETISLAMTAAETGHLVLATLHTNNTIRTINRLVGTFPPDEQPQIRTMLSESLRAVISQRLLKRADGKGRIPAYELLKIDRAVANVLRENRTFQLRSTLQTGQAKGMQLLDNHLVQLVKAGAVTKEEALRHIEDKKLLGVR